MIEFKELAPGLWHVTKFFPDHVWESVVDQVTKLSNDLYDPRTEPNRLRLEVYEHLRDTELGQLLIQYGQSTATVVKKLVNSVQPSNGGNVSLWRDLPRFQSPWHADEFTRLPTAQIYMTGLSDSGTAFDIDGHQFSLPFTPNTGYLMDNSYQYQHGMLKLIGKELRQSMYLIYR